MSAGFKKAKTRARESRTLSLSLIYTFISDRRSIKWPFYAVNSSRNGLHSHFNRDVQHEVNLEKSLEQPNIDLFLELAFWYRNLDFSSSSFKQVSVQTDEGFQRIFETIHTKSETALHSKAWV